MAIDLFDPTTMSEKTPIEFVPRLQNIEGLKAGLVDNTKHNSKTLLLKIADRLKARYKVDMAHLVTKASASHPVSEAALKIFKEKADFVIAGIGD